MFCAMGSGIIERSCDSILSDSLSEFRPDASEGSKNHFFIIEPALGFFIGVQRCL
jgi:hypothetical protein